MYCKKCGMEIDSNAKFCSNCGEKVEHKADAQERTYMFAGENKIIQNENEGESEKERLKKEFHIDSFDWNLDGYPATQKRKTEDADFNWSSVLESKKKDATYEEPISFEALNPTPKKVSESQPEEYIPETEPAEEEEETDGFKQDDTDIMELSFEDEIFGDIRKEKPATATIRIDQTIHFTDQLYSFNSKQAEFQSVLDEEYERLQNEDEDDTDILKRGVQNILEEHDDLEPHNNISSDDFLKELYGKFNESDEIRPVESDEEVRKEEPDICTEEENFMDEIPASKEVALSGQEADAVTDKAEPVSQSDEVESVEFTAEKENLDTETSDKVEEPQKTKEDKPVVESEETEASTAKEVAETEETDKIRAALEESEDTPDGDMTVEKNTPEYIGVALARTPRGVLIIEKNNREKLSKIGPSPSSDNEKDKKQDEYERPQIEEKKNKLSFGDVFNSDDDDNYDEDNKPKKKGKALKVIAIILCIIVLIELVLIGIQYFAPDTEIAHKINNTYSQVISKILPGREDETVNSDDIVVKSQLADYIQAEAGKYENIAEVCDNPDLKFGEQVDYELEGYKNAGTFTDSQWYTDEDGNGVTYGQALVKSIVQYYSYLIDYKNDKGDDVFDLLSQKSPLKDEIAGFEVKKDIAYAINSLEIGEVKTSEHGLYVMVKVRSVESKTQKETLENQIVFLMPEDRQMKIDNIISI